MSIDAQSPTSAGNEALQARLERYTSYESTPDEALALFREAREAGCPVARSEKLGGYHMFLDYDDVRAAHADHETFASSPSVLRPIVERPQFPPIEYDPPEQTQWRALFAEALNLQTPKRIEAEVRRDVIELIDGLRTKGRFDLVDDFAEEVPLFALCHVLGFDRDKRGEIRRLTVDMHAHAEDPIKGPAAFMAFAEFGIAEVMSRLEEPRDDYLTHLSTATIDGRPLTPQELGGTMNSLLNAGHGTTVSGLTSLLYEVYSRPEVKQRLIDDPSLIPAAVEESMRLHTPFFGLYRRATRDVTVGGVEIAEGDSVQMCWAAANRDPKVFENPDEFDLDRPLGRKRLMTFGFGIHVCMGQPTARMEMHVALEELLKRVPEIELDDPAAVRHEFAGSETALITALPARLPHNS
ncbi:MAG: cytochrome [Solirubrobacterales bacterium]|nr:cytochrome [Solirubrobacterales bacterium]